eukprot:2292062-Pleurochrysis_carterae.AAC.1
MATAAGSDAKGFLPPTIPRAVFKWELRSHEIIRVGLVRSWVGMEQPEGVSRCVPRAEYL